MAADINVYLQFTQQGDPAAPTGYGKLWIGSLTEGGRSAAIVRPDQQSVIDRAIEILGDRGIVAA